MTVSSPSDRSHCRYGLSCIRRPVCDIRRTFLARRLSQGGATAPCTPAPRRESALLARERQHRPVLLDDRTAGLAGGAADLGELVFPLERPGGVYDRPAVGVIARGPLPRRHHGVERRAQRP